MPTKLIPPSAGDILRHAASLIEEWGMCKYQGLTSDGRMCEGSAVMVAGGAITHVQNVSGKWSFQHTYNEQWPATTCACIALQAVGGGSKHNDLSDTTQSDAIKMLLFAAKYADKKGW